MLTRRPDRPFVNSTLRHPDTLAVAALLIATGILLWQRFWFWNGLDYLDIPTFYAPWYGFLGEQLRALNVPGWNPHQFSGTPFAADPQSGWWYFPAMAFFSLLNPVDAYIWTIAFHLTLAGISTYIFARMIGCRAVAAFVAAFLYEFGPLANHVSCCLIHVQLATWIPTALIGVELSVRRNDAGSRFQGWALTAFALSQMFAGWVGQGAYNAALVVGAYLVVRNLTAHPGPGDVPTAPISREYPVGFNRLQSLRRGFRDPAILRETRLVAAIVSGCVTFGLALGFAAAGLWPRLDLLRESNVAGGEYTGHGSRDYALGWSAPEMLDKLLSDGNGYFTALYYLGAPAVALALIALPLIRRNVHAAFCWGLVLVTSVLALERVTPLHRLLYLMPRFEPLHEHVPMRILSVQWIGIAVLAGIGLEHLLQREHRLTAKAAVLWIGIPLLVVIGYLTLHDRDLGGWSIAATMVLLVLVVLQRLAVVNRHQFVVVALVVVVVVWEPAGRHVVDAVAFDADNPVLSLPGGPVSRETIAQNVSSLDPGGAGEFLQQRLRDVGPYRFFGYDSALQIYTYGMPGTYREWYYDQRALDLLINARAIGLGLYDVQGYNPVQLVAYVDYLSALNQRPQNYHDAQILTTGLFSRLLDLLSVRYVVVPATLAPGRPDLLHLAQSYPTVFENGSVRVLERPTALPRAWVVRDVQTAPPVDQLAQVLEPGFDPASTVIAGPGLELAVIEPSVSREDVVSFDVDDPDQVLIQVDADAPGVLVVNEIDAAGWNAYVNGQRTAMVRANGAFRAIVVPAGSTEVVLRYEPASLRLGLWLSLATFSGVLIVLILLSGLPRRLKHVRRIGRQSPGTA